MSRSNPPQRINRRKQLIEEAMIECYQFWAGCVGMQTAGGVPYEYRLEFFKSLRRYLKTIEPLQEEPVIRDWWDSVDLSKHWVDEDEDPVTGFDAVHDIIGETESFIQEKSTIRGSDQKQVHRQYVPGFPVLEDIFDKLNLATGKLGFNPEIPEEERPFTDWGDDFDYRKDTEHELQG